MLVFALVYPESAHVGRATALAVDGKEKVIGTTPSRPISKEETERSEVNLLNIAFNQDLPSLSARLFKAASQRIHGIHTQKSP